MATVKFNIAIDMRTFAGYDFSTESAPGGSGSKTDTMAHWAWKSGFFETVTGSGFGTSYSIFPTTGIVTGWTFGFKDLVYNPADPFHPTSHGYTYWTFNGLSAAASDFSNAIQHDSATLAAYMPTILAADDTVIGSEHTDYLLGFAGNDILKGGPGADTMAAGAGNDTYYVETPGDLVVENAAQGIDTVKSSISILLQSNVENLTLLGTASVDGYGNELANHIVGNSGTNILTGGEGKDVLKGFDGDDTLYGGLGSDKLYGGNGADNFVFDQPPSPTTNLDTIMDFYAADDTMVLKQLYFSQIQEGTLDATAFYIGSAAHDADDRIIYDLGNGHIYYDPDGTGSAAQILFAQIAPNIASLTSADFLIVP